MKAISVRQPYAGLIIAGIKNVENRTWKTNYTGQLVIVSTAKPDAQKWWAAMRKKIKELDQVFPEDLCKINGAALGVVDFNYLLWMDENGDPTTDHPTLTQAETAAWWNPDMIGFYLENPRRLLAPIPITGRLGLYTLPAETMAAILAQLETKPYTP